MKHTVAGTAPAFDRYSLLSLVSHPEMALGTLNSGAKVEKFQVSKIGFIFLDV
jgi:hypothetical protein